MRQFVAFLLTVALCGGAQASWYWPFDSNGVDERPKRVSELIEPASILIEEASDLAAEEKIDEAVEKYRKALDELNRIELENPDRAKGVEFATLRNKRAYVNAAIDSLLLEQVKSNAKAVAATDTTELEKRLDRERWGKRMDKAGEALGRRDSRAAMLEFEKAKAGTTNVAMIAATHVAVAGACCQKGAFEDAHRALARSRQELVRAGGLSGEEKRIVQAVLQTLQSSVVDGHAKALVAGRRACDDSARLTTMGLTSSNAVKMARGVAASLDTLQGHVTVFAFPAARSVSRAASNVQMRVSLLLERMEAGQQNPTWNVEVSGLKTALGAFAKLSPEIDGVKSDISSVLKAMGEEVKEEKKAKVEVKEKAKEVVQPPQPSQPPQPPQPPQPSQPSQPPQPSQPLSKRDQALMAIAKGDWTTAERLVGEMLVEKPNGAMALNLKAAMQARQGKLKEAEATLDQAILSNPRNHFAYYNMANLMLQVRKDDKAIAKRYYETGRDFGGPVDAALEEAFK